MSKRSTIPCNPAWNALVNRYHCYRTGKYLAAKILSLEATSRNETGEMQELQFLKAIQRCEDINCLPILRDDFFVGGPRGNHLCFIMDLLSTNVSSFRRQFPKKALPPFWVKNIIVLVLEGLVQLHDLGIIHTGESFRTLSYHSLHHAQISNPTTSFSRTSLTSSWTSVLLLRM